MHSAPLDAIDASLVEARLHDALRAVAAHDAADRGASLASRRLAASVFAIAGRERDLAAAADPQLLACRSEAEVLQVLSTAGAPQSHDLITAATLLTWIDDRAGAYSLLREARDRAGVERRFHVAVAACELLAHHSILFGDLAQAATVLDEGLDLASRASLRGWEARCAARGLNLALDVEDLVRADRFLGDRGKSEQDVARRALFAPGGVRLALLCDDEAAVRAWTSEDIHDLALHSRDETVATAAAMALILAAAEAIPVPQIAAIALRRSLAAFASAANSPEFLALASRFGTNDEASLAAESLSALFAPQRRYIEAHSRLARAYVLLRRDDRAEAINCAGDAARAFDAIGARYWTNQAMSLLVRPDNVDEPALRRRPSAVSLTRREQQVAHLIRRGASNREVARTLQISEHTVERHVSSILSRLGLRSRWQIADVRIAGSEH